MEFEEMKNCILEALIMFHEYKKAKRRVFFKKLKEKIIVLFKKLKR